MTVELLPDLLRRHATIRPGVPALVGDGGVPLSYGDWWQRAQAAAAGLVQDGVRPGTRVALVAGNAAYDGMGIAYLATLLAGGIAVPLSSSQPPQEIEETLRRANPALVVTCGPGDPPVGGGRTVALADLETADLAGVRLPRLRADHPAELLSTSGTTGLPRLIEADHGNLARDFDAEAWLEQEPYYYVHALALGTNVGQVALRTSLTLGYSVVALEVFDLDPYVRLAAELPMRETLLVPAMAASLGAEATRRGWRLPETRVVAVSGAATPSDTWQSLAVLFPNATFINTYTTTEAWPARTTTVVDPERITSVGRPLDDQAVDVRDADGRRLGPFERGTIHLAHQAAPARRFVGGGPQVDLTTDGWVETDDIGYLDGDGFLYVEDRKSDVISTGGHTVSTLEVEGVLTDHPQVAEAAVFGLPHRVLGSFVAACVVASDDLDLESLEMLARERLAPHKVPRLLRRVDSLPRTRSGKVAKRTLREELGGARPDGAAEMSRSGDEALIRAIWEQVLELPGVGVDQRFFTLGGDSLSALRIVSRIRAEVFHDVSTAALLAASTVAEQAAAVGEAREPR